jgi:uncharacterized protein YggE
MRPPSQYLQLATCVLLLLLSPLCARADAPASTEGITVTGTGEAKARPTVVEIGAIVAGEAELTNDAMVKYRDAKKRATTAIDALKIPNLTVESNGVSISQAIDPTQAQMMMQGRVGAVGKSKVQASESLKLVLKDVDKMPPEKLMDLVMKVIDTGRDAGLQVGPPTPQNYYQYQMMMQNGQGQGMLLFKINDSASMRDQAYKQAMDDAKSRAQRLAELAGVKLGRIVAVRDTAAPRHPQAPNPYAENGGASEEPSDLSSQLLTDIPLKVTLTVQYEIAAK